MKNAKLDIRNLVFVIGEVPMEHLHDSVKVGRFDDLVSDRARNIKASEIREILKLTKRPEIISFAGGLPNPLAFPKEAIDEINKDIMKDWGDVALQYGLTEGFQPLREELVKWMGNKNVKCDIEGLFVTHGSQQTLDLLSKVFLNPDDVVVVGAPTYLGGASAFNSYQAHLESIPIDDKGIDMDMMEEKVKNLQRHGKDVKFLYMVPDFQNPSGVTMPRERRKRALEIATEYDVLIIEDNPYGELRYEGDHIDPILSWDTEGRVIYTSTFSKILCPGFRIAWAVGDPEIIHKLVHIKQGTDLCTNSYGQVVSYEYMHRGYIGPHIEKIKEIYGRKQKIMLDTMDEVFDPEVVEWTRPEGGMFTWATLPEYMSTRRMFKYAVDNNVAYVMGKAFYPTGGGDNCMRLNFTHPTDEKIVEGIHLLWDVIQSELKRQAEKPMLELEEGITI